MTTNYIMGVLDSVESWFNSNSATLEDDFKFIGFDAVKMRERITKDYEDETINNLLMFCMMRGTIVKEKGKMRMSDKGLTRIQEAIAEMRVKTTHGPDDITISRLCCCFPERCATILKMRPQFIKAPIKNTNLPNYLCFPQGASLIHTDNSTMFNAWKEWAQNFNELIKGSNKDKREQFMLASLHSKVFSNEDRLKICASLSKEDQKANKIEKEETYESCSKDDFAIFMKEVDKSTDLKLDHKNLCFRNILKDKKIKNPLQEMVLCIKISGKFYPFLTTVDKGDAAVLSYNAIRGSLENVIDLFQHDDIRSRP